MSKPNCWESKKCGREVGGARSHELGVCPAAKEDRLDSVHGGRAAGRACWVVAGTFCQGRVQGSFAVKYEACVECNFYQSVLADEQGRFRLAATLLAALATGESR